MTVRKIRGVYYVDFWYEDPLTNKRKPFRRSCGGGRTKRVAQRLERRWMDEAEAPPVFDKPKHIGFRDFSPHWLDVYVVVNCKPSTYRSREQVLRNHMVPFFGNQKLRGISPEQVQQYKALKTKTLSPKTVNNHLGVASRLFRSAVAWNYADRNPVTGIGFLQMPPQEYRFWDREQS